MPLAYIKKCYTSSSHKNNRKRHCLICLSSDKFLLSIQGKLQSKVEDVVKFKINAFAPTTVICALCKIKI